MNTQMLKPRNIRRILVAILFCWTLVSAMEDDRSKDFSYESFSSDDAENMRLTGDATLVNSLVQLTSNTTAQSGSIFLKDQLDVTDFEFTFTFQISGVIQGGADGFSFIIQNDDATAVGQFGEGLGYAGLTECIAIEFDTYQNTYDSPSPHHISIQTRYNQPNSDYGMFSLGYVDVPSLKDGNDHTVRIKYHKTNLSIYYDEDSNANVLLSATIDIQNNLHLANGTKAWVGFAASTGVYAEYHVIKNWTYKNHRSPPLNLVGIIAGTVIGGVVLIAIIIVAIFFVFYLRKRRVGIMPPSLESGRKQDKAEISEETTKNEDSS